MFENKTKNKRSLAREGKKLKKKSTSTTMLLSVVLCTLLLATVHGFDSSAYELSQVLSDHYTAHWRVAAGELHLALVATNVPRNF